MLEVIATAFPGSRLRHEKNDISGLLCFEGQLHSARRLRQARPAEVVLELPALDGFELAIKWGDRWIGDVDIGDQAIDDAFFIHTNDPLLATTWNDDRSRRALDFVRQRIEEHDRAEQDRIRTQIKNLQESRRMSGFAMEDDDPFAWKARLRAWWQLNRKQTWDLEVRHGCLTLTLGTTPTDIQALIEALEVACAIAGAPGRWGQRCAEMGQLTGLRVKQEAERIALGEPALVLEHQGVDVELRYLRSDPAAKHQRLTTRVRANRSAASNTTWSAIDTEVPRGPVPDPPAGKVVRTPEALRRLEVRCAHGAPPYAEIAPLFWREQGNARAVIANEADVTVWFDGAMLDAEPIALATRLVAEIATDKRPVDGPYR